MTHSPGRWRGLTVRAGDHTPEDQPGRVCRFATGDPVRKRRFPRRGSLARRLLASYLLVVLVDIVVFVLSALVVSPSRRTLRL